MTTPVEQFDGINDGDIIRLTQEGTFKRANKIDERMGIAGHITSADGISRPIRFDTTYSEVTLLEHPLPPEPAVGTVVMVTYAGVSTPAMHCVDGWRIAGSVVTFTWDALHTQFSPVIVWWTKDVAE